MENVVAVELLRRISYWSPEVELYYYKDYSQREVDFVIKERELKALVKASKELSCGNLKVITWDYEGEEELKGRRIRFVPLWKWLLVRQ